MIRGFVNSPLPIQQRSNASVFGGIGQFVMVARESEATRQESIGENLREAQALLVLVIFLRDPEREPFKLVQEPMRFSIVLPRHKRFISYTIVVDRNK